MTHVRIVATFNGGEPQEQVVDLESTDYSSFVASAVVSAAMLGDIVRTAHEYVHNLSTFTLIGSRKKSNGDSGGIKWRRTYTLLDT